MKRRNFFGTVAASVIASLHCNPKLDQRKKTYDERTCPFCTTNPGHCTYCDATGSCTFCNGTGTRKNSTAHIPDPQIEKQEYSEKCPFCDGTGKCRYCHGQKKCWVCEGKATINDWNFYEKYTKSLSKDSLQ